MKVKGNRNHIWSTIFFNQLSALGVKYACISPGSRSTPIIYSLSKNKKIKCFIHVDERSSAFFALGLAKATNSPVLVVTTSGTAVAELYPAIIEAYQQRTPLIICTADRPPELIGTGANQTINQHNIFRNHIRWFRDLGLPSISETGFYYLQKIAVKAFRVSQSEDRGPVHINFPFDKPLEPFSYTDKVNTQLIHLKPHEFFRQNSINTPSNLYKERFFKKIIDELIESKRGIIVAGPMEYDRELIKNIRTLSTTLKYPVFADGLSQLRFNNKRNGNNIISVFNLILSSEKFINSHPPDLILQFGRTPTSSHLESFFAETKAARYLVNTYGDKFDPTRNASSILSVDPLYFCKNLISAFSDKNFHRHKSNWLKDFVRADEEVEKVKSKIIQSSKFPNEISAITEIMDCIPSKTNLVIGNSLPVRDLDYFSGKTNKNIFVHFNRGASGIDGVTSTALGIASQKRPTILITGDLSFIHDLGALSAAVKYSIQLTIVIINNNGGGIFESLPIANRIGKLKEYFIAPHNLDLGAIVKSFGINYKLVNSRRDLKFHLVNNINKKLLSVIEIRTDAIKSVEIRKRILIDTQKILDKEFAQ